MNATYANLISEFEVQQSRKGTQLRSAHQGQLRAVAVSSALRWAGVAVLFGVVGSVLFAIL